LPLETQLEVTKADIVQLDRALEEGTVKTITQAHESLTIKLRRFTEGLNTIVDGERLPIDPLAPGREKLRVSLTR
jgi:hypothetical protein